MGRLDGRVAFVTGAGRGQGRAHAVRLAREGADVIAVDICADIATDTCALPTRADLDETAKLVDAEGRSAVVAEADVRDYGALRAALDAGVRGLGRLDVVVANAGIGPMSAGELTDEEEIAVWSDLLAVNLTGVFLTAKVAIPHLGPAGAAGRSS